MQIAICKSKKVMAIPKKMKMLFFRDVDVASCLFDLSEENEGGRFIYIYIHNWQLKGTQKCSKVGFIVLKHHHVTQFLFLRSVLFSTVSIPRLAYVYYNYFLNDYIAYYIKL